MVFAPACCTSRSHMLRLLFPPDPGPEELEESMPTRLPELPDWATPEPGGCGEEPRLPLGWEPAEGLKFFKSSSSICTSAVKRCGRWIRRRRMFLCRKVATQPVYSGGGGSALANRRERACNSSGKMAFPRACRSQVSP
eukprot:scaffold1340_cov253-Pinguiococcus_pyrenoidosus.AAC.17